MGRKGDLLELIDSAPIGVHTLTGSVWKWKHNERSQRALMELSQSHGGAVGFATSGGPLGETSDQHLRVWLDLAGRWRLESEDYIDLQNGSHRWVGSSTRITDMSDGEAELENTEVGLFVAPGNRLLGALLFGEVTEDMVAGRPCLKVNATVNRSQAIGRFNPVHMRLGGIEHTFWFDAATGIVLRHVGMIEDEPCTITEFKEISVNPPLTDLDFAFVPPPDAVVTRQVDHLIQIAEGRGVDLSGVDRGDLQAVQEAFHHAMRPDQPTPEAQLEMQKVKHVPVGDPPEDEAAARESIEYAFNHLGETDDDGVALVNVQNGRDLAGPLSEAQKRVTVVVDKPASLIVDAIKFLRSDEAVVWFSVEVNGERFPMVNGREGRAVKVGERWVIEHATIADLLQFAGVVVPPPEE